MTNKWKFTRNYGKGQYRTDQARYYKAEKDFQVDLNGDGTLGYKLKNIESKGNTLFATLALVKSQKEEELDSSLIKKRRTSRTKYLMFSFF